MNISKTLRLMGALLIYCSNGYGAQVNDKKIREKDVSRVAIRSKIAEKLKPYGVTPLHFAVVNGDRQEVADILSTDEVDVNAQSKKLGKTALHLAVDNYDDKNEDSKEMVKMLLNAGADPLKEDKPLNGQEGMSLLEVAAMKKQPELVKTLFSHIKQKTEQLYLAATTGNISSIRALVSGPEIKQNSKDIALWGAAARGQAKSFEALIASGAKSSYSFDDLKTMLSPITIMLSPIAILKEADRSYIRSTLQSFCEDENQACLEIMVKDFGSTLKKARYSSIELIKLLNDYDEKYDKNMCLVLLPSLCRLFPNHADSYRNSSDVVVKGLMSRFKDKVIVKQQVFPFLEKWAKEDHASSLFAFRDVMSYLIGNKLITGNQALHFVKVALADSRELFQSSILLIVQRLVEQQMITWSDVEDLQHLVSAPSAKRELKRIKLLPRDLKRGMLDKALRRKNVHGAVARQEKFEQTVKERLAPHSRD